MTTISMAKTNDRLFIVADSSGLFSLTSPVDVNHTHAVVAAKRLSSPQTTILVPYDVYAETVNLVGKKAGHAKAVDVAHLMHSTPPFVVIDSSSQARRNALDRFAVPHLARGVGTHSSSIGGRDADAGD